MIVRQSRLGFRTSFDFGDERVTHTVSDGTGAREYSVPYDAIHLDDLASVTMPSSRPTMYLWAAGFPVGFTALRIGYDHQVLGAAMGIFGFALIFLGMLAKDRKWFVIRLNLIPVSIVGAQSLRVLRDKHQDQIIARLADGRRTVLRAKYATINPTANPHQERARFDWLLEQGVIDAWEHDAAMSTLSDLEAGELPLKRALN